MTKKKQKSVWVIEEGCYSDYRVVGVYSSEANAEKVRSSLNAGHESPTIAEWLLDPGVSEVNAGLSVYRMHMAYDGAVEAVQKESELSCYGFETVGLSVRQRTEAIAYAGKPIADCIRGSVWAKDEQHAVKIANEFRTQQIALGNMHTRL